MKIDFSAPSKTFLAGEYAVLKGAPALILATGPRFEFRAERGGETSVAGIPVGSPAAKWIEQRRPLLEGWKLEFVDPHAGKGGFGASSAQFLFVHALTTLLQMSVSRAVAGLDLKALLNDFKVLSGGNASGADVLAQATGGLAIVEGEHAQAMAWPFPELDYAILRTGHKVATHTHLAELDCTSLERLVEPARKIVATLPRQGSAGSVEKFLQEMRAYATALRELNLQAPATLKLLNELESQFWCKAAKGCGALGADTILVFFAREDRDVAEPYFASTKLERIPSDLSEGLQMNWSWH